MEPNSSQNNNQQPNTTPPQPIISPQPIAPQTTAQPDVVASPQPVVAPQAPQPNMASPQPIAPQQNTVSQSAPLAATASADNKLGSLKYIATIFGVATAANIVSMFIGRIMIVVYITTAFIAFSAISKLKEKKVDSITEKDKSNMAILMTIDPLIVQALYYYRLKKTMPQTANIALSIGWKTLFIDILLFIVFIFVLGAIFA